MEANFKLTIDLVKLMYKSIYKRKKLIMRIYYIHSYFYEDDFFVIQESRQIFDIPKSIFWTS